MKIFLSHSSNDKWLARRIAADIAALGAQTFLDEKDILTGESIDAAIQSHLAECSDFLILLSPASIKSEWVLVELGGALALKKSVIPILLYLGPNDIPKPISKIKGRDIGDIEKYYDELRARIPKSHSAPRTTPAPLTPRVISPVSRRRKRKPVRRGAAFSVGDSIIIPKKQPETAYRGSSVIGWNEKMSQYLGLVGKVAQVLPDFDAVRVDLDQETWIWANEWLTKQDG